MKRTSTWICGAIALAQTAGAEMLTFSDRASWESWDSPFGLVDFSDEGQLQLKKFSKNVAVVAAAGQLSQVSGVTRASM